MAVIRKASSPSFSTLSSASKASGDFEKEATILFSLGYWFSNRTAGLLAHPYITMRKIMREQFLRPLVLMPTVWWILSWIGALIIGRVGLLLDLNTASWSIFVGRLLVFIWVWGTMFLGLWQMVLGYLYVRFRNL